VQKKKKQLQLHLLRLESSYAPYNKEEKQVVRVLYDEYSGLKKRLLRKGSGSGSVPLSTVFEGVVNNSHDGSGSRVDGSIDLGLGDDQQGYNLDLEETSIDLSSQLATLEALYNPLRQQYHYLTKNKKHNKAHPRRSLSKEEKRLLFPDYDQYRELKKRVRLLRILIGKKSNNNKSSS